MYLAHTLDMDLLEVPALNLYDILDEMGLPVRST